MSVPGLQSSAYNALIDHVRYASFRKVLISPLLSCMIWGQVLGVSFNIHSHMGLYTHSAVCRSTAKNGPFQLGTALPFIVFLFTWKHLVWIISGAQSDVHIVQEVWYASLVQVQSFWLGKGCGSAGVADGAASGAQRQRGPAG